MSHRRLRCYRAGLIWRKAERAARYRMLNRLMEAAMSEISATNEPPLASGTVLVAESGGGRLMQFLLDGRHRLIADEPRRVGGDDAGPHPHQLLLMSPGACTSLTPPPFGRRQHVPLQPDAL